MNWVNQFKIRQRNICNVELKDKIVVIVHLSKLMSKCDANVDTVYRLENIYKTYQHEFHLLGREEYWL
ncbi:hypothetical protein CR513_22926, partial [Mucuna pruriens]